MIDVFATVTYAGEAWEVFVESIKIPAEQHYCVQLTIDDEQPFEVGLQGIDKDHEELRGFTTDTELTDYYGLLYKRADEDGFVPPNTKTERVSFDHKLGIHIY